MNRRGFRRHLISAGNDDPLRSCILKVFDNILSNRFLEVRAAGFNIEIEALSNFFWPAILGNGCRDRHGVAVGAEPLDPLDGFAR